MSDGTGGDGHGHEKDSLEIVIEQVHLEGVFKCWGRLFQTDGPA